MDKVKEIGYQVFVKHLFWTLSLVIVLMLVGGWWYFAGDLKGQFASNKKDLEGKISIVQGIQSKPITQRVNSHSHAGMEERIKQRKEQVYVAWYMQYYKQRKLLKWPDGPDGLAPAFITRVEEVVQNRPIEVAVTYDDKKADPIKAPLREHYRDKIQDLLPTLAERINARWQGEVSEAGEGRGPRGRPRRENEQPEEDTSAVTWEPSNQSELLKNHFDWTGQDGDRPTTLQILYAQEDYQVLDALMQIVARTNHDEEIDGPAEMRHRAKIRRVEAIQLGRMAQQLPHTVTRLAGGEETGEDPRGAGVPPASVRGVEPGGEFGGERGPVSLGGVAPADPAELRYVNTEDKDFVPLTAEELRGAASSTEPEKAPLTVAKRMPVYMKIEIDQRHLNQFFVECGNADLMLEIKNFYINTDDSVSTGRAAAPRGFQEGGGRNNVESGKDYIWDVTVEVYGLIYIFNPPSLQRLQLTEEEAAEIREKNKRLFAKAGLADVQEVPSEPTGDEATDTDDTTDGDQDEDSDDQPPADVDESAEEEDEVAATQ